MLGILHLIMRFDLIFLYDLIFHQPEFFKSFFSLLNYGFRGFPQFGNVAIKR